MAEKRIVAVFGAQRSTKKGAAFAAPILISVFAPICALTYFFLPPFFAAFFAGAFFIFFSSLELFFIRASQDLEAVTNHRR